MTRNNPTLLILVAAFSALTTFLLVRAFAPNQLVTTELVTESGPAEGEAARGPHGGRLLEDGAFAVELVIVESGIPPEFRLYAYKNGVLVAPAVALGGVADKEPLPWNSKIAVNLNYRAAVDTRTNGSSGIWDIL